MKLHYAYTEKDIRDIEKMRELLKKFLAGQIDKFEFDKELMNIRRRQQTLV